MACHSDQALRLLGRTGHRQPARPAGRHPLPAQPRRAAHRHAPVAAKALGLGRLELRTCRPGGHRAGAGLPALPDQRAATAALATARWWCRSTPCVSPTPPPSSRKSPTTTRCSTRPPSTRKPACRPSKAPRASGTRARVVRLRLPRRRLPGRSARCQTDPANRLGPPAGRRVEDTPHHERHPRHRCTDTRPAGVDRARRGVASAPAPGPAHASRHASYFLMLPMRLGRDQGWQVPRKRFRLDHLCRPGPWRWRPRRPGVVRIPAAGRRH